MDSTEILDFLLQEVAAATQLWRFANEAFQAVIKDIPSGIPHPDGVQRIHDVSAENAQARRNLHVARIRLEHFQAYGYIPPDLRDPRKEPQSETNPPEKAKGKASGG